MDTTTAYDVGELIDLLKTTSFELPTVYGFISSSRPEMRDALLARYPNAERRANPRRAGLYSLNFVLDGVEFAIGYHA